MWTLRPGTVAAFGPGGGKLYDLISRTQQTLRPEDAEIVEHLALGAEEDSDVIRTFGSAIESTGWAVLAQSTFDPEINRRLSAMNQRYAWSLSDKDKPVMEYAQAAHASRRHFGAGFGQHSALPTTVARRCSLAGTESKKILVMGDDDFVSVALQYLGHEVTVLEIDPLLVGHFKRLSKDKTPKLDIRSFDLREPFPQELWGKFDYFYADPMSCDTFFHVSLSRGMAALKPGGKGFICCSEAGWTHMVDARERMKFTILHHYSDFNQYYTPTINLSSYVSDLLVISPPEDVSLLQQWAEQTVDARGMMLEARYGVTPASHHIAQNIDPEMSQIIHLKTGIDALKDSGGVNIVSDLWDHQDHIRTYLAITDKAESITIRVNEQLATAEVFVTPANPPLESALFTIVAGLVKADKTVFQKHRHRNLTWFQYPNENVA